jgi:hypothetical protein
MTDPRAADTTPLNSPDVDVADLARELSGTEERDRQDGILDADQVDIARGSVTDTELYEGASGVIEDNALVDSPESLELLEDLDLRSDETSDPNVAAEEGLAWVPPSDPPIVPSSEPGGASIAAGFGSSALDEPYDADHHDSPLSAEDEMSDRVREALRADASTTQYADSVDIESEGGRIVLRGVVEDLEDDDNVVAVASTVTGVAEVVDRLVVATI